MDQRTELKREIRRLIRQAAFPDELDMREAITGLAESLGLKLMLSAYIKANYDADDISKVSDENLPEVFHQIKCAATLLESFRNKSPNIPVIEGGRND